MPAAGAQQWGPDAMAARAIMPWPAPPGTAALQRSSERKAGLTCRKADGEDVGAPGQRAQRFGQQRPTHRVKHHIDACSGAANHPQWGESCLRCEQPSMSTSVQSSASHPQQLSRIGAALPAGRCPHNHAHITPPTCPPCGAACRTRSFSSSGRCSSRSTTASAPASRSTAAFWAPRATATTRAPNT